jgi:predicted AAA+ superfamily ATPase
MEEIYYALNPWWENKNFDTGIRREEYLEEIEKTFKRKQIDIIIGSRRVGKTTFLKQVIKKCLDKDVAPNTVLYLALDNPKLSKTPISEHLKLFRKMFMHSRDRKLYLFLDEVQESPQWETELKSIYDLEDTKIFCTGSTSSLVISQGGKLTGRQMVTTLYPLNFREYLSFKGIAPSKAEDYKYERLFEEYLQEGGYPENVLNPSEEYLNNLLEDIIARDLVRLYYIKRADLLRDLLTLLAASVGSRISFNKLANTLGITVDTVKEYIGYFESAFLVKVLEKWSTSYTDKIYAQKKIYLYDTGIKTLLTGKEDLGFKVENIVFSSLVKKKLLCGYYAESEKELDFAYGSFRIPKAIEIKYDSKFDWHDKRFMGVRLFLRRYPQTEQVVIVSKDKEAHFKEEKTKISVIPAWKFLLKG